MLACGSALCTAAYQSGLNLVARLLCGVLPEGVHLLFCWLGRGPCVRESDGGAQPHYLYLVNNYSILHSNDSTGHGVPSAVSSGPQSLLFHARGTGFSVCCL